MASKDTAERVERMILECGQLGVMPTPEAIAEIMVDQDGYLPGLASQEAHRAYGEYREVATGVLIDPAPNAGPPAVSRRSSGGNWFSKNLFWRVGVIEGHTYSAAGPQRVVRGTANARR